MHHCTSFFHHLAFYGSAFERNSVYASNSNLSASLWEGCARVSTGSVNVGSHWCYVMLSFDSTIRSNQSRL